MRKRSILSSIFVFFAAQALTWAQPHYSQQTILGLGADNLFVAASSDASTLAIGGETGVWVFTKEFGVFGLAVQLVPSIAGGNGFTRCNSVSMSGDGNTVLCGSNSVNSGTVFVFVKPPGGWNDLATKETARLNPSDPVGNNFFGTSVAASEDGRTVVVGATEPIGGTGAAYVFVKPAAGWPAAMTETAQLTANTPPNDQVGLAVAISGDGNRVAVTSLSDDAGLTARGAGFVFEKAPLAPWATTNVYSARLRPSSPTYGFGVSTAMSKDGNTVVIGATRYDGTPGAAFVFARTAGSWPTAPTAVLTASDAAACDFFGNSVSVSGDGNTVLVGAPLHVGVLTDACQIAGVGTGAAYVFSKPGGGWINALETAELLSSNPKNDSGFGYAVAVSADAGILLVLADNTNYGYVFALGSPPVVSCGTADGLWHGIDVVIPCAASDSNSGLLHSADANFTLTTSVTAGTETASAFTNSYKVFDTAGASTNAGPIGPNLVDKKPPSITCGHTDGLWHATDVGVACIAIDGGSGLASLADGNFVLVTSAAAGTEAVNATNSHTVSDKVGNSSTVGPIAGILIDEKPPSITCGHPDGLWHSNDVFIACIAIDGGSGLANQADSNFVIPTSVPDGTETNNASSISHSVSDKVGNTSTAGPIAGNMVDKKAPVITINQPTAATYTHSSTLTFNYTVTDGGSGVGSITPTLNGGATVGGSTITNGLAANLLTALPLGPNTFAIRAADKVGNISSASVTFTIVVTAQSMLNDVTQLQASSAITLNVNSLLAKLNSALADRARGQCGAARELYAAFVNEVTAQTGKGITNTAAAILIADAQYLEANCP